MTQFSPKINFSYENGQAVLDSMGHPGDFYELILSDLNMPQMDGVEFVRHQVEHDHVSNLILLSSEDECWQKVLTYALIQAKALQYAGLSLRVAIKLSMDKLNSLDFLDDVVERMD